MCEFAHLLRVSCRVVRCVFFFNDTATTEIYTLSLHDALPISQSDGLLRRHVQSNAGGAHHALSPVRDLLGTLDIALDGRGDERACGANCLVEAVPVSQQIDHASYRCLYIHTGQVLDAIPPLTEVRGFLAEMS